MFDYKNLNTLLFRLDPERAHTLTQWTLQALQHTPSALSYLRRWYEVDDPRLAQSLLNTNFPNPVGLAAGFDKNAEVAPAMGAMGFGFVEVGAVTPEPQPGNPKPRLFRFEAERSVQNAMGFNNKGMEYAYNQLTKIYPTHFPIGINLGKNKHTPAEQAVDDYARLIETLQGVCDYLVVNLSSPNTPGLRDLQNEAFIGELFERAQRLTAKPILLKLSPDMTQKMAIELSTAAVEHGAAGIIATNTTMDHALLPNAKANGGISGHALRQKSFEMFEAIAEALYGRTLLISVGGIDSSQEAYRRIRAGASLVQLYTALVFEGPALAGRINRELLELMEQDGFTTLSEAIGADRQGGN